MTSLRPHSATHEFESVARPVIVFDAVRKVFAARRSSPAVGALDGVSLSVGAGEIVGVIGRSGAGKSTLIRLVNGLEKPTGGTVTVDGTVISALDERGLRAARRSIGMIFQHFNLLSSRTAFGNVALPLEIAGRPTGEIRQRVGVLLELVGLADKRDRYPAELSGGEKQRVGIARALATAPKVLLSDEATSALDPETTAQILALLKRINRELGLTILLITHEMAVVKNIAEKVIVLEAGRVIEQGATFDIFAHPQHPTTRSFVGTVTGSLLPEDIGARLKPQPFAGSQAVLKIVWSGDPSGERVLGQLARTLSVEVSLLHGQIDSIAGRPFGTLSIALPDAALSAATEELARQGLQAEVLGHVA
ncbi:MAG: methionine ABC transporter ATP-binding protein [Reyranellaceae bacterium]